MMKYLVTLQIEWIPQYPIDAAERRYGPNRKVMTKTEEVGLEAVDDQDAIKKSQEILHKRRQSWEDTKITGLCYLTDEGKRKVAI